MNRKGQTLIIFVILIPVLILVVALVVDIGLMTYHFQKYRGIVDEGIKLYFEKNISELEKVYELNNIDKEEYMIIEKDEKIEVVFETTINSIFGRIINMNEYQIRIDRVGSMDDNKVLIEKKE